jgi:hypothetical protein
MAEQQQIEQVAALLRGDDESDGGEGTDQATDAPEETEDSVRTESRDSQNAIDADTDAVEDTDETGSEGDSEAAGTEEPSITVKDLAEKLGIEAKDLYEDLHIPTGDGESITLGEFKDRVKELQQLDTVKQDFEDREAKHNREVMAQQAELNQLLSMIPDDQRQQLVQAAGQRHHDYVAQQQNKVLEVIPEWKDPDTLARDRDAIIKLGNDYGFSSDEITYTHDSRTLLMVRDMVRLRERLANADPGSKRQDKAKAGKPGKGQTKRKSGKLAQAIRGAKESSDPRAGQAVVSELLRNQR